MTQEANKNEKSKVPFLEDALDNLDAPQVDSSDLGENSIGDDLDTLDLGGDNVDYDDDSILLEGSKIDADNNVDLDTPSSPSSTDGESDINLTIDEELGLPVESDDVATQSLPVENEDTLDLGVDELGLPVESDDVATQIPPVEDEDTLDLGVDELGLPVESDDVATQSLPVEDEDVLDLGVDELGLPVESDDVATQSPPVEDEDTVDEFGLPLGDNLNIDNEDASLPAEDDTLDVDDDLGSPELPSSELEDSDELDLIMGDTSNDSSSVAEDENEQPPELGVDDNDVEDDLDGGFDLLMGGDDTESESESESESDADSSQPALEDDFDSMMNSDEQSNYDPISNWEQEDDDDIEGDDEDLLDGFMPDGEGDINQPLYDDQNDVDAGVADMLDNFAPTMSKDEDIDNFLSDIESKNAGNTSEEEDFLPEIKSEEEKEEPAQNVETSTHDDKQSTDENQEVKEPDGKKTGFIGKVARIGISVALACGVGFGALYVSENGIPKEVSEIVPSTFNVSNDVEVQSSVMKEIKSLRSEVQALSSEVKKVKSNAEINLTEYKRLVSLQAELSNSHTKQMDIINSIKSSAKKYEGEMINRLEKLALYVKSVETGNNEKQSIMRESLYKELVAYIKANASNDDAGKLTELAENLRKQSVKTAQLDAALQAQRRVVSIIEDEQNYLRGTVDSIRESRSAPSVNLLKSDNEMSSVKSAYIKQVESEKPDEACCVFVEEKKAVANNSPKAKKEDGALGYRLVSVINRGGRSWDIFLEPTIGKGRMGVEKYTLTPMGSSSVPGYGRIIDVVELKDGKARIPYKVITDNGVLFSRKKG
jgi:hypothetical protein